LSEQAARRSRDGKQAYAKRRQKPSHYPGRRHPSLPGHWLRPAGALRPLSSARRFPLGLVVNKMKQSAFLLNVERAQLIVEQDLADVLYSGRIAGAAGNVLSTEPPAPANPLLSAKNCIVTPRLAWATKKRSITALSQQTTSERKGSGYVNRRICPRAISCQSTGGAGWNIGHAVAHFKRCFGCRRSKIGLVVDNNFVG
jgi:hypothetical protein